MGQPIDGLTGSFPSTYEEIKSASGGLNVNVISGGGGTPPLPTGATPSNATSAAYEASRIIKSSAGVLLGFTCYNSLTSTQFIQLHDSATLPADGAIPVVVVSVPAATTVSFDVDPYGRKFVNGIVLTNSTTGPTKTIGAANLWIDAQYT